MKIWKSPKHELFEMFGCEKNFNQCQSCLLIREIKYPPNFYIEKLIGHLHRFFKSIILWKNQFTYKLYVMIPFKNNKLFNNFILVKNFILFKIY